MKIHWPSHIYKEEILKWTWWLYVYVVLVFVWMGHGLWLVEYGTVATWENHNSESSDKSNYGCVCHSRHSDQSSLGKSSFA